MLVKVVIQGEDSFVFEDIGDKEHQAELPQARSVDRQKTVSFANSLSIVCESNVCVCLSWCLMPLKSYHSLLSPAIWKGTKN